jgi:DNA-binding FadR family transcriptional regulator
MPKFSSVKPNRVSDNIAAQLKNAILGGGFKPGEKLPSERELTEEFQASRVVVREGLRTLELSGFVEIRQGPYGGAYVLQLGYERLTESYTDLFWAGQLSVQELVQARIYLEPEVTCLAAENLTEEWAAKLKKALASEQVATRNHADWVCRNMATDRVLIEMCGNRFYQAMLEPLIRLTQEIVLVVKPERTIIHDPREHQAIVDAVLAGDGQRAANAMRRHIRNVGESLIGLEESYRKRKGLAREASG